MKRFVIITGTSRGLGAALAKCLMGPKNVVLGVSRKPNIELTQLAADHAYDYQEMSLDLSLISSVERVIQEARNIIEGHDEFDELVLINNAGVLEPVTSLAKMRLEELMFNIDVNVKATLGLTNGFIGRLGMSEVKKLVINLSSGAGKNPYEGWAAYCASKAAVDMFSRCVAAEESKKPFGAAIYAVSPGVVDTNMQVTIRSKTADEFPMINKFLDLKENNLLKSPEEVAGDFKIFIESNVRPEEIVCHINDLV